MLRRPRLLAVATLLLSVPIPSGGPAQAQQAAASCYRERDEVICDVRTDQAKQVRDISATVNAKPVTPKAKYEPFSPSSQISAWYFLIQQTANPRDSARAIERIVKDEGRRNYGVAVFADKLDERIAIGTLPSQIGKLKDSEALKPKPPSDVRTNLFFAANEAINKLAKYPADRRALVLFADGRSSSSEYRQQLIETAKEKNVLLFNVFMSKTKPRDKDTDPLVLENLARETKGVYKEAIECTDKERCTTVELPDDLSKEFLQYLDRGGKLSMASSLVPTNSDLSLNVDFTDGTSAKVDRVAVLGKSPNPAVPDDSFFRSAIDWLVANSVMAGAIGALGLGTIVLGALMMRRPQPQTAWGDPVYGGGGAGATELDMSTGRHAGSGSTQATVATDTVILTPSIDRSPPPHVYAWLQFLDADARRVPIGSTNVRIGRSKDNDIILQNKTVHRQHAVIKRSPDGVFSIHHLGGENVVVVNGRPGGQADLNNNDMIELGEVRMRFFANA